MTEWLKIAPAFAVGLAGAFGGWLCAARMGARSLKPAQSFAAGVMLALSCMSLLPQSFERMSLYAALACTALGMAVLALTQNALSRVTRDASAWTAILGITAHNIPEGMVIGAGMAASPALGASLALSILLHDVPEGAAVALPLRTAGRRAGYVLLTTLASGLPTGVGALIGAAVGGISQGFLGASLAFAAGAMLWVSLGALLPESLDAPLSGAAACLGVLCGVRAGRV